MSVCLFSFFRVCDKKRSECLYQNYGGGRKPLLERVRCAWVILKAPLAIEKGREGKPFQEKHQNITEKLTPIRAFHLLIICPSLRLEQARFLANFSTMLDQATFFHIVERMGFLVLDHSNFSSDTFHQKFRFFDRPIRASFFFLSKGMTEISISQRITEKWKTNWKLLKDNENGRNQMR